MNDLGGDRSAARLTNDEQCTDTELFEAFYEREWPAAVRLAALLTQHRAPAEDIAQDAFARLVPRWSRLDNPSAYFRTTLVNEARRWHRHNKVEQSRLPALINLAGTPFPARELSDAVAALPYRQRAVIVLRYHCDLSESEIARAIGCRRGTVKSLASRALARLYKEIARPI
jgi:RNA polymerase sigma-70 factor (sigma-E family)